MSLAERSVLPAESLASPSLFMAASSRGQLVIPAHISLIEDFVMTALARGDQKITIEKPVRHGGSVYISRSLPAWMLGTYPWKNVGIVSHEQQFASSWGAQARDLLIEYGPSFGMQLSHDVRSRSWWETEHGGSMRSFGIRAGGMTGRGFDLLIFDDLIKSAADADSQTTRDAQWDFLKGTAMSRRQPGALLIVMSARWHEDDLIGRIHREQPGEYQRLRLPAIAEVPDAQYPDPDPLGRQPGEALWPQVWPLRRLEKRRLEQGEYYFNANYQQRPSPPLGSVFQRSWWKRWTELPPLDDQCWSWDMSFKDESDSSFVVGQLWARRGADFFVRHQVRGQWNFPTTKEHLKREVTKPEYAAAASRVFIEDKANGPAIIADLKHELGGLIPVAVGQDSKVARARSISGYVESGNVYLPANADWVPAFIDEHAVFPKGAHDDQVDALSQGMRKLLDSMGGSIVTQTGTRLPTPRGR